ncbi:lysophospholipid acyltransferase family protein [Thalassobium sp. R2A62]|jgi:putative hemolysin|uniref:lysophospholipid acyltransferase family protein n=1 Tax=Thalassobium sp. R2A62 TaxID=633131 RepID=UPI0001B1CEDC|nr:lysophospholipid acyltransferase family protein [Thalassobium sp. R2A62]EET47002.1 acyltransferase domain protein [Thalassobium sp. R2A62]MDG1338557.1 lysophospholipid acyltransferase family protein [Paracoccaceae bacterium]MDG2451778.1 lysophospholipid acyltransferase family protein [Paracoccaceae bacterium]
MTSAKHISYAHAAQTRSGWAVIRVMENVTGRTRMLRRARGFQAELEQGQSFWNVMTERYGLTLDIQAGALSNIPTHGPVVLVANHPYGILDGLMLGHILDQTRGDFRVLANDVFRRAPALADVILPISFDATKEAAQCNIQTRAEAHKFLLGGGAMGVFPGGTVSTRANRRMPAMDPSWRTFTAKMIMKSRATVIPIHFEGANSGAFQLASQIHSTLRMGLLIREFRKRVDQPVVVSIGTPLTPQDMAPFAKDPKGCMDFLRKSTYELSQGPCDPSLLGYDFDIKGKGAQDHGSRRI